MPDLHPIVTIRWCGSIYVQGPTLEPLDRRGFVKTDMHGRVGIRLGDETYWGRPIERVARAAPHPVSQNIREDREPASPEAGGCKDKGARGKDKCDQ